MIKYLGSKKKLIPGILSAVQSLEGVTSVLDLFSGTSRVGHALKRAGYQVTSNDLGSYAHILARCYVQADNDLLVEAEKALKDLSCLKGSPGFITRTYCEESRFFQPKNGERIDAIRAAIQKNDYPPDLEAVLLTSLLEAADRVDSTVGLQMAYLKKWAARSYNDLELRVPDLLPRPPAGPCRALNRDASKATFPYHDLVYLDPPYNQHSYLGNYHIWETIVRNDSPETYGVACKRVDVRDRKSPFNSKRKALEAFQKTVRGLDAKHLLVSFSDEGYLSKADIEDTLSESRDVECLATSYDRHIGFQLGVFNPQGVKTGEAGPSKNTEYLFIARGRS